MSSTLEKTSADQLSEKKKQKQNLRKGFKNLKTHAIAVANFTLQWQDLEDHFLSTHNLIQAELQQLQDKDTQFPPTFLSQFNSPETHFTPTLLSQAKSKETQFSSKETHLTRTLQFQETQLVPTLQSQFNSRETQLSPTLESKAKVRETQFTTLPKQVETEESLPENGSFSGIPVYDGKALVLYLNEHEKEHESMHNDVYNALKVSEDSGKLVLEAMKWFYPQELDMDVGVVRKSCVLLLEELMRVRPVVKEEVREEAMKLAIEWKGKMRAKMGNCLEVLGFLQLLAAFGLVGEFDGDEILSFVCSVARRTQALELVQALGFTDKASDFIEKLISKKKRIDAIRFIYEFKLVDKFPPVPLLQDHLKYAKNVARMNCEKGKNSLKEQDEATKKEIAATRAVIRCVENYKLGSQYSLENLKDCIKQLKEKKKERTPTATAPDPKAEVQEKSGNKRHTPDYKDQQNQGNIKKRPRTPINGAIPIHSIPPSVGQGVQYLTPSSRISAPPAAVPNTSVGASSTIHSRQPSQGAQYLTASGGIAAPAVAVPNTSIGASSNVYLRQPTHHRPQGLFAGQGAQYLTPSAGMAAPAVAISNTSVGASATIHSWQPTHHRPEGLFTGQGPQYLIPSAGHCSSALSSSNSLHTSLSRNYGLAGSSHVTQHMSLTSRHLGLTDPAVVSLLANLITRPNGMAGFTPSTTHMSSSARQYGTSIAANGSSGQFGSAGIPTAMGIAPNSSADRSSHFYSGNSVGTHNYRPLP